MHAQSSTGSASSTATGGAVIVACPQCHTRVRVSQARLTDDPICSRCKSHILPGRPLDLNAAAFGAHVERSSLPVLVDFWAPWCGPCRMMAPVLERVADRWRTRVQVGKVNSDEQPDLAQRFAIRAIPTLILFREGQELARQSGAVDGATLSRWLDGALKR